MNRTCLAVALGVIAAAMAPGVTLAAHPHHMNNPARCVDFANAGDPGAVYWEHHDAATGSWWAEGHGAIHNHVHKNADGTLAPAASHNPHGIDVNACP